MDNVIDRYLLELEALEDVQDDEPEPYTLNELIEIWQELPLD